MDEIQTRLKETSDVCLKAHEQWAGNKKDKGTREALQEAIHESRKVISRLEIDLAISERDEMAKPIPVPQHRSNSRPPQGQSDDSKGNGDKKPQSKPLKASGNS